MNLNLTGSNHQPQRSPERQHLADAIAEREECKRRVRDARGAIARGEDMVAAAKSRLAAAEASTAASRTRRAQELAHAVEAGTTVLASPTREARIEEADAQDDLDAARAALVGLQKRLGDAEDAFRAAQAMVVAAADIVLRSEARRVLAEACAAAEALKRCRTVLLYFQRPEAAGQNPHIGIQKPAIGEDWAHAVREFGPERASRRAAADREAMRLRDEGFAGETEAAIRRHLDFVLGEIHQGDRRWWSSPDLAPWVAARAALMDDPDAPLPPI